MRAPVSIRMPPRATKSVPASGAVRTAAVLTELPRITAAAGEAAEKATFVVVFARREPQPVPSWNSTGAASWASAGRT